MLPSVDSPLLLGSHCLSLSCVCRVFLGSPLLCAVSSMTNECGETARCRCQGIKSTSIVFRGSEAVANDPYALFCAEDRNGCHLEVSAPIRVFISIELSLYLGSSLPSGVECRVDAREVVRSRKLTTLLRLESTMNQMTPSCFEEHAATVRFHGWCCTPTIGSIGKHILLSLVP